MVISVVLIKLSNFSKSTMFLTGSPFGNFHFRLFHPGNHSQIDLIKNCESVLIKSLVIPQSCASCIAKIEAWISPQLLVGLPITGFAAFLEKFKK